MLSFVNKVVLSHQCCRFVPQWTLLRMASSVKDAATQLDVDLMGSVGRFSIDQLMELAACSVYEVYADKRVLVLVGPGNNGGDGLVAARHLKHFGCSPSVYYPKRTDKPLYSNLVAQCETLGIPTLMTMPSVENVARDYDIILDALFGFSFKGPIKAPFDDIISTMVKSNKPIASIDIPSGWHVESGDVYGANYTPEMLISLTAPKDCARLFKGRYHYLGGRFVPPRIIEKYNLMLPQYPGAKQCVDITNCQLVQ